MLTANASGKGRGDSPEATANGEGVIETIFLFFGEFRKITLPHTRNIWQYYVSLRGMKPFWNSPGISPLDGREKIHVYCLSWFERKIDLMNA